MTRWAVVTGAGRGIGAAVSMELAAAGFSIAMVGRDKTRLESVAGRLRGLQVGSEIWPCDLLDCAATARTGMAIQSSHPRIHALVNNAGVVRTGPVEQQGGDVWQEVMAVNLELAFKP